MKFKVEVEYTMVGSFEVEAESLDKAIEIVENGDKDSTGKNFDCLPSNGEYLDDSFQVNHEVTIEANNH